MIETVKKFIKNNSVVLIIVGIGCMFILFNVIGNCRADKQLQQMQPTINRQMIIDSVNNATRVELIKQRDSLIKESEKKLIRQKDITSKYTNQVSLLKAEVNYFKNKYKEEPTISNCDSIVGSQTETILAQDTVIESLGQEAEEYSRQVYLLKVNSVQKDSTISYQRSYMKLMDDELVQAKVLYEKLSERRKIGNAIRNTLIATGATIIFIKSI